MGKSWTVESLFADLDALGESEVRYRLDSSVYGSPKSEKYLLAQRWLRERENTAAAFLESEKLGLAKVANTAALRAAVAAERAADSARRANTIAIMALAIAAIIAIHTIWPDAIPSVWRAISFLLPPS